ncbi:MAG TPA: serine/threonine-protein kinase [Polyangia bacterium]|nr:serine/threonine-protein kinase [Polyangia bacterium]
MTGYVRRVTMTAPMQSDEQALDPAAHHVDKYRPIARIGRGGMAEVLLAVLAGPAQVRKLLVLKRPLSILSRDADFNTRFLAEARIASRLNHPNVISTFEVGQADEGPFIVMEYLDGQPLSKIYKRLGALQMPLSYRLHVLRNLLAGLDYVHTLADFDGRGLRLVHRDVSPQNVFICYDGRVSLVDFGIAKAEGLGRNSRPGIIEGKIAYMAPEQLSGRPADHRVDLFAFGVILWETLSGQRITMGAGEDDIVRRRMRGEIPDIREYAPETPQALLDLCQRTLTLLPEDRIPSAAAIMEALDLFIDRMGARINDREVGQYIGNAFSAERDARRRLIESQMAVVEQGMPPTHLPDLSRDLSPGAGSESSPIRFAIPEEEYDPVISHPTETTRATVALSLDGLPSVPTLIPTDDPVLPPRKKSPWLALGVATLVAATVVALIVTSTRPAARSAPRSAVAAPHPQPAGKAIPAGAHEAATVRMTGAGGSQSITIGLRQLTAPTPAVAPAPAPKPAPAAVLPATAPPVAVRVSPPATVHAPTAVRPAPSLWRAAPASEPSSGRHASSSSSSPSGSNTRSASKRGSRNGGEYGESISRGGRLSNSKPTIDADNPYAH